MHPSVVLVLPLRGVTLLLFFHLLAGVILGLILAHLLDTYWAVPASILGALLPDLVDKPLALVFASMSSGRTFGHSLIFIALVAVIGLLLIKSRLDLAVTTSMLLHQAIDLPWKYVESWFYPLYGGFHMDNWVEATGGTFFNQAAGTNGNVFLRWLDIFISMEAADPLEKVSMVLLVFIFVFWAFNILKGSNVEKSDQNP